MAVYVSRSDRMQHLTLTVAAEWTDENEKYAKHALAMPDFTIIIPAYNE